MTCADSVDNILKLEPNPQKFSTEALGALQVHLVVSSRCTAEQRGQNTWSHLFFPDTQTQRNACGCWTMQICHLLGAMRVMPLYVLNQTIGLGNCSLDSKGQVHLRWAYHSATHMQPTKLTMFGNKFILLHSVAKYIWIYSTYATVTGANTMLAMGEILVKRDFSGIAEAIPQLRIDFRPRLV